uniref:Uncharacterized protein n=1 Tax=Helicotheca tamesis TaxID=374047 RepID=A0A7S2I4H9_9STRA|mmetsp:Transcript_5673/g.7790  ORF Transcript_5673/g.7790 Transcript_5673/m.7790 type:complete len:140 (+) Transcript_5673:37-456(+)
MMHLKMTDLNQNNPNASSGISYECHSTLYFDEMVEKINFDCVSVESDDEYANDQRLNLKEDSCNLETGCSDKSASGEEHKNTCKNNDCLDRKPVMSIIGLFQRRVVEKNVKKGNIVEYRPQNTSISQSFRVIWRFVSRR